MINRMTTSILALLLLLAGAVQLPAQKPSQNDLDEAGFNALYSVFPKNVFPVRGRIQMPKTDSQDVLLSKLEGMGKEILGTKAEPLALFYRGNLLFNLERFGDALENNRNLKKKFSKHGLCRSIVPSQMSMVDNAINDIETELNLRKEYEVVKLPHAEIDLNGKAVFHTADGSFEIHCYTTAAPKTVANFKKHVEEGYYVGMSFHKLLSFRRMTIGCPNTKDKEGSEDRWGKGGPGYDLPVEYTDALHVGTAVSMVGTANGMSHGSQFTICLHNQPELNNKQAVFGKLTRGLEVLRKMSQTRVKSNGRPTKRLEITGTQWVAR